MDTHLVNQWTDVKTDILRETKELEIPRYYWGKEVQDNDKKTLHVFVGAIQKAYGAFVYISKGAISAFVIAKNRVAPLKGIALPKLEFMVAVSARFANDLIQNFEIDKAIFWGKFMNTK